MFRSDNGNEFICLTEYFRDNGVIHETSCVGTPQQNGRVERKHRHILNVARAVRFQANLPIEFWRECALTAGYLINRTPSAVLKGKTLFEMLYNRPPPIQHLRVFGCLCYVHEQRHGGDKFASRSKRSIFIGYPFGKKGWRVYDLETGKILVSRDVIFCEDKFPFEDSTSSPSTIDDFGLELSILPEALPSSPPAPVIPMVPEHTPSVPLVEETETEELVTDLVEGAHDDGHSEIDDVVGAAVDDVHIAMPTPSSTETDLLNSQPIEELLGKGHR